MNRERICEEDFVGGGKNDFLDSFTEEDMNGGEKGKDEEGEEMIPISCEIKRIGRE